MKIERIFSQFNLVKNKTRNNLTLNTILCVRYKSTTNVVTIMNY